MIYETIEVRMDSWANYNAGESSISCSPRAPLVMLRECIGWNSLSARVAEVSKPYNVNLDIPQENKEPT